MRGFPRSRLAAAVVAFVLARSGGSVELRREVADAARASASSRTSSSLRSTSTGGHRRSRRLRSNLVVGDRADPAAAATAAPATPPTESSAAQASEHYQHFKRENPRHPAYPNAEDRVAEAFTIALLFFFIAFCCVASLYFLDRMDRYFADLATATGSTDVAATEKYKLFAPFLIPPVLVWLACVVVGASCWGNPVRGHLKYNSGEYSICSEMLAYVFVGTVVSVGDFTLQVYYRLKAAGGAGGAAGGAAGEVGAGAAGANIAGDRSGGNITELRSVAAVSTALAIGIHVWGGYLAYSPGHDAYCVPLLTYAVLAIGPRAASIHLFFLALYVCVMVSALCYVFSAGRRLVFLPRWPFVRIVGKNAGRGDEVAGGGGVLGAVGAVQGSVVPGAVVFSGGLARQQQPLVNPPRVV